MFPFCIQVPFQAQNFQKCSDNANENVFQEPEIQSSRQNENINILVISENNINRKIGVRLNTLEDVHNVPYFILCMQS